MMQKKIMNNIKNRTFPYFPYVIFVYKPDIPRKKETRLTKFKTCFKMKCFFFLATTSPTGPNVQ